MNKRRHELERNELADRLESGIESAQSYIPLILGGIAVVVLGALGWGLYSSSVKKTSAAAWADYYFVIGDGDADTFLDVSDQHDGTPASDWARLTAAAGYLESGLGVIYTDAKEAKRKIELAIEQYEPLRDHSNTDLRTKALLGLAQSYESLGDVAQAIEAYEDVRKTSSQPQLLSKASERIDFLNSDTGKEFYAWFKELEPTPDAPIVLPADITTPPTGPDGMEFSPPAGANLPPVDPTVVPESPAPAPEGASIPPIAPAGETASPEASATDATADQPPAENGGSLELGGSLTSGSEDDNQ